MESPTSTQSSTKNYIIKSILFLSFIIVIGIINNSDIQPTSKVNCIYDYGLNITGNISSYIFHNKQFRNKLIIVSSLTEDLIAITLMSLWIGYGKSWFVFFTFIKFYTFRMFVQFLYNMPFPELYSFYYPGFPSLVVSYLKTNDFFYSGHVAMPLISGIEFYRSDYKWIFYICVFASFYEAFIVLNTRAHYGIDLLIGWIFALYFSKLTTSYIDKIDKSCISIDENLEARKENKFIPCSDSYEKKFDV